MMKKIEKKSSLEILFSKLREFQKTTYDIECLVRRIEFLENENEILKKRLCEIMSEM